MTAEDALKLGKNPEVKAQLAFIVAFGELYWTPGYNWIRQKDKKTMLEGHCCHEVLLQVFCMYQTLSQLKDKWVDDPNFAMCKVLTEDLSTVVNEGEKMSARESTMNRYDVFFNLYMKGFKAESGFKQWMTNLSSFTLASSNSKAVRIYAAHVLDVIQDDGTDTGLPLILDVAVSPKGIHAEFKYSNWKKFLHDECTVNIRDSILEQNSDAIVQLKDGIAEVWRDKQELHAESPILRLKEDLENIVLTAKHHGQQAEAGVQEISI